MAREAGRDRIATPGGWWAGGPRGAPPQPLDRLRFHHRAYLSGFLPRARLVLVVGVSRFQYSKSQEPGGLGGAWLKVEGAFVSGLDIWDLLPSRLKLVTAV